MDSVIADFRLALLFATHVDMADCLKNSKISQIPPFPNDSSSTTLVGIHLFPKMPVWWCPSYHQQHYYETRFSKMSLALPKL